MWSSQSSAHWPSALTIANRSGATALSTHSTNVTVPSEAFENGCVVCYANDLGWTLSCALFCGRSVVACRMAEAVRQRGVLRLPLSNSSSYSFFFDAEGNDGCSVLNGKFDHKRFGVGSCGFGKF